MMRSLYTGLSGVKNHQSSMDVVGNNIANVNTVGFKSSRATFADMLSQKMQDASAGNGETGSTNPKQVGLGTNVESIDLRFKDGAPMMTGKNTDLCLSGEGLFVVRAGNQTYYTRDGAFDFDAEGNFVLPGSGHFVQGWMAAEGETGGVIDTTGAITDIKIGGEIKVKKTEEIWEEVDKIGILEEEESRYNLNVTIGDNDYVLHYVGNGKNHEEDIDLSKKWTVKDVVDGTLVTLVDDSGNTSTISVLSKGANNISPGDSFSTDTSQLRFKSTVNKKSPLEFIVDGINYKAVDIDHSVEFPGEGWIVDSVSNDGGVTKIGIAQYQNGNFDGCYVNITLDGNSQLPTVGSALEFSDEALNAPQYRLVTVEKEEVVTLKDIQIDSNGIITGIYADGTRRVEAQVALAHFSNAAGLIKTGTSLYQETANSGTPVMIKAGEYGTVLTPGALEMSNVDVATEFANMIITQRGFQSNAKIITVGDEMVETAVNMKR